MGHMCDEILDNIWKNRELEEKLQKAVSVRKLIREKNLKTIEEYITELMKEIDALG